MDSGVVIFLLIVGVYFLPSLIAAIRDKASSLAIFVLNLCLGWTFIGWVISLVWAFSAESDIKIIGGTNSVNSSHDSSQSNQVQAQCKNSFSSHERTLANDKFKLFLIDMYRIRKSDLLNQYIANEKIYNSLDDALLASLVDYEQWIKADAERRGEEINLAERKVRIIRGGRSKKAIVTTTIILLLLCLFIVFKLGAFGSLPCFGSSMDQMFAALNSKEQTQPQLRIGLTAAIEARQDLKIANNQINQLAQLGFINKLADLRVDYTDMYRPKKPIYFLGNEVILLENSYMNEWLGCCLDPGMGILVKVSANNYSLLDQFAKRFDCGLDGDKILQSDGYKALGVPGEIANGGYAHLQCGSTFNVYHR